MTSSDLKIGGKYNWKNQPERLVYMGWREYPDGLIWHRFAKVELPEVCWSEVRAGDLQQFEESK